jgi:diketogulonate reductase-like aldo/keto reductase
LHGICEFNRWDYSDRRYCDAMKWLYTLQQEGKIKELGLTNFDTEHMAKIVEDCGIPVVSNQVSDLIRHHSEMTICLRSPRPWKE